MHKSFIKRADEWLLSRPLIYRTLVLILPIAMIMLTVICSRPIIGFGKALPTCLFYRMTGLYCPGCGITRSVVALLKGDILLSLRSNSTTITAIIIIITAYIEWIAHAFGKKIKTYLHSGKIMAAIGIILLIWLVIRNFFPILCPISVSW